MSNNIEATKFANIFNKQNGIFTYSGEMAIEIALKCIDVEGKKVVVQNNVCHRVLLAILRSGAIPVIIKPSNSFNLSTNDIEKVMNVHKDIVAIIIVHQYGIRTEINQIKKIINNNIKIIEDIAQGWNIKDIGKYSDYVVTSFGESKQLSFGIGGGIFTDNEEINSIIDINFRMSRKSEYMVIPYILPSNIKIKYKNLKKLGNKNIKKQIRNAKIVQNIIKDKNKDFNCFEIEYGVWNRFPIWTSDLDEYEKMKKMLDEMNIKYELPYKKQLEEIAFLQKNKYYFYNYQKDNIYIILIKTRANKRWDLSKWKLKEIR